MRLIDIILESNAVEKAKQMGLVKKPGVALYGPPGDENPASHKIRGGELTPLKATDASRGMGQHSAIGSQSDLEKSTPSGNLSTGDKPTQFSTIEEISQRVRDTFTPDGRVDNVHQTLSAVTSHFGRETCAPVYKFGPEFYAITGFAPVEWLTIRGVFHSIKDVIGLLTEVPDKPISEYDVDDVRAFKTAVHEALHSARRRPDSVPRDQHPLIWDHISDHPMGTRINEGMTEYLAQEITSTTLSDAPGMAEIDWEQHGSYPVETDEVRFMVERGNFDVVAAYQNYSYIPGEDGNPDRWEYLEHVYEALDNPVIEYLTRVGFTEEDLQEAGIISALRKASEAGKFLLTNPRVMEMLELLVDSTWLTMASGHPRLKPHLIDYFLEDLSDTIRRAMFDVWF